LHGKACGMCASVDTAVRDTLRAYFAALHQCDEAAFSLCWHPRGVQLSLATDGSVECLDGEAFWKQTVAARGDSTALAMHDGVLSVEVLDGTCASAKVQLALPPIPEAGTTEAAMCTEWLTLLHDPSVGSWRIISKTSSSDPLTVADRGVNIRPQDVSDVTSIVWDGYIQAGRACDSAAMSAVFHPHCNLTFASADGVAVIGCADFCTHVGARWTNPKHQAWAHLKDDPRASAADTLLSVDFASSRAARVTLRVGYPPFLYHDVLLLLKASHPEQSVPLPGVPASERSGWWLVAKSSANTPFLVEEAAAAR